MLSFSISASNSIKSAREKFGVRGVRELAVLDGARKFLTDQGVELIIEHGLRCTHSHLKGSMF